MARRILVLPAVLAALFFAFATILVGSGTAHADPKNPKCPNHAGKYPPGQCKFVLGKSHGQRGESFGVAGSGFTKSCGVIIYFAQTRVGTFPTSPHIGAFKGHVTVPTKTLSGDPMPVGNHLVTAVDRCGDHFAMNQTFHVDNPPAASANPFASLPHTGAVIIPVGAAGAAMVLGGSGLIMAGRRRRRTTAAI
jgi:LPXTG-motif cell wall-anchored protein